MPKEIRRTLRIREGDPLEIYTSRDGGIVLKKYSPIGELGELAEEYVESVAQVAKCTVCVADRDAIVAVAGPGKKDFVGKNIHKNLIRCIDKRKNVTAEKQDTDFCDITEDEVDIASETFSVILSEGDAIGAVILLSRDGTKDIGEVEEKIAICGANFLGRQMEG